MVHLITLDPAHFHAALGVDPTDYDMRVFRLTSEISKQVFPVTLNIEDPRFLKGLEKLRLCNEEAEALAGKAGFMARIKRTMIGARAAGAFLRLYTLPATSNALPQQIRLEPVW